MMRVYADRSSVRRPDEMVASLRSGLSGLRGYPAGLQRHGELVSLFIAASELTQGLADSAFERSGVDACSAGVDAAMTLLMELARAVIGSWRGGFADLALPEAQLCDGLLSMALPARISVKVAEGYAYYALYPEAYLLAAERSGLTTDTVVIGLRSIGTGLAAIVAAALGAPAPITLRPVGPPFQRQLSLAPALATKISAAQMLADPTARFAIVDEGPGLSGSSFGCVLDLLERAGVRLEQISCFPSHGGDLGPKASDAHRSRWTSVERCAVTFDQLVSSSPLLRSGGGGPPKVVEGAAQQLPPQAGAVSAGGLADWAQDLIGPALATPCDLSGGAWRARRYGEESHWPPVNSLQERRKSLVRTRSGEWLLEFVGLGEPGRRAFERASRLAQAGFSPEVLGLRHGFLVSRWIAAKAESAPGSRDRLVTTISDYLAFRAQTFVADPGSGASAAALLDMARVNAAEALGERAAARLDLWCDRLDALQAQIRLVDTDNRLHAWEWLCADEGRWLKTDAVSHAHSHDLVGSQDIAWDVVGAAAELDLTPREQAKIRLTLSDRTGRQISPDLLSFYSLVYLAFQLGAFTLAAEVHGGWPQERDRLGRRAEVYRDRLNSALAAVAGKAPRLEGESASSSPGMSWENVVRGVDQSAR